MSEIPPIQTLRDAQREDLRFRSLRALGDDPGLSQRGLARETGVSLGAANALLNGLIADGLVEIGTGGGTATRLRFDYLLTAAGRRERTRLTGPYLDRRRAERRALDAEIAALEAGDVTAARDGPNGT